MPQIRFALLQARTQGDPARDEEHKAFAARIGVPVAQLAPVDIFSQDLDDRIFEEHDALLVGGSGEYSVLDDEPNIKAFIDFLGVAAERGFPTFASCFGYQALVLALGGEVISDQDNAEVGSYTLQRTAEAAADPVFQGLPPQFIAQLGHKDRASVLPSSVVNLAHSERCPFQALRVGDKPVYATQFHPELTWLDNRRRFERYMDIYGKLFGEDEAIARLESHTPGPEANQLIPRFVEHVFGEGGEGT